MYYSLSQKGFMENNKISNRPRPTVLTSSSPLTYGSETYLNVYIALAGGPFPQSPRSPCVISQPLRTECFYQKYNSHLQQSHQQKNACNIPLVLAGPSKLLHLSSDNDSAYGSLPASPSVSPTYEVSKHWNWSLGNAPKKCDEKVFS